MNERMHERMNEGGGGEWAAGKDTSDSKTTTGQEHWAFVGPPMQALLFDDGQRLFEGFRCMSVEPKSELSAFGWSQQLVQNVVELLHRIGNYYDACTSRTIAEFQDYLACPASAHEKSDPREECP